MKLERYGHAGVRSWGAEITLDVPWLRSTRPVDAVVRTSVHDHNDEFEVERLVRAVAG